MNATETNEVETLPIEPGLYVQLGHGGPCMVVTDVGRHTRLVWCRWVGPDGRAHEGSFPVEGLKPYQPAQSQMTSLDSLVGRPKRLTVAP